MQLPRDRAARARVPLSQQEDRFSWWWVLLVLPFIALLWVPSYVSIQPELAGIPFFYWYQFLWVILSAVITAVVYVQSR